MWNENEKKPIGQYLALTFLISWGSEAVLILGERLGILTGTIGYIFYFIIVGFGAGFAPMYAVYILLKRYKKIAGLRDFCKRIFRTDRILRTSVITAVFCGSQTILYMICNEYLNNPWYLFIVFIPMMIIGGGLEEIGWTGFLQPAMEERFPFPVATFIVSIIWAVWHVPLWFSQNASQSSMNFLSFSIQCVALAFIFATLYKLTKSPVAIVFLHAWNNVLGGMFTLDVITKPVTAKLIIIYAIEIVAAIVISSIADKKRKITANEQTIR